MLMREQLENCISSEAHIGSLTYSTFKDFRSILTGNPTPGWSTLKDRGKVCTPELPHWPNITWCKKSRRLTQKQMRAICNSIEEHVYSSDAVPLHHSYTIIDLEQGLYIQNEKTAKLGKAVLSTQASGGDSQCFELEQGMRLNATIYLRSAYGSIGAYLKKKGPDGKECFVELGAFHILFVYDGEVENRLKPNSCRSHYQQDDGVGIFVDYIMNFFTFREFTFSEEDLLPENDIVAKDDADDEE